MQPPIPEEHTVECVAALADRRWLRRSWLQRVSTTSILASAAAGWFHPLLAAEPTAQWPFEVTAGLFRIHADFEISGKGELISELDRLSGDVVKMLDMELPRRPVHVVIFSSPEEYQRYMKHYYPALPERRALFIQQRGANMLFAHRHAELAADLRHETVHAILNEGASALPLWLDEGLAEYFEVPAEKRWAEHGHLREIRALAGQAAWTELETLEELGEVSVMTSEHYRDAWAWVHFLLHRRVSTRRMLVEQVRALRSGQAVPPLSRAVSKQLPEWRSEFSDHFQHVG